MVSDKDPSNAKESIEKKVGDLGAPAVGEILQKKIVVDMKEVSSPKLASKLASSSTNLTQMSYDNLGVSSLEF